jgi:DNA mismatch endonuclease, patch repair protein
MDKLSAESRSALMARVKSRDTKPEWVVRRLAWSLGYRYRLHAAGIPGTPDMVFASRKKAIFIHGCFWHRHSCRRGQSFPSTRIEFWSRKFARTKKRDAEVRKALKKEGWSFLLIWECELADQEALKRRLMKFLEA